VDNVTTHDVVQFNLRAPVVQEASPEVIVDANVVAPVEASINILYQPQV
jgi:hypothetical protein